MPRLVPAGVLASLLLCTVACHTKGKDCSTALEVWRKLDDATLMKEPASPADIEPDARPFLDVQAQIAAMRPQITHADVTAVLDQIDAAVSDRIQLLRGSTFKPPAPAPAPTGSSPRDLALAQAARLGAAGLVGTTGLVNPNAISLEANRDRINQLRQQYFSTCP
jgi:hypothetical protein